MRRFGLTLAAVFFFAAVGACGDHGTSSTGASTSGGCFDRGKLSRCSSNWCFADQGISGLPITSVSALGSNDAWATAGALLHWDGTSATTAFGSTTADGFASVFEASPTEIWTGGAAGIVRFRNGNREVISPNPGMVSGSSSGGVLGSADIWVTRSDGVSRWDGTSLNDTGFIGNPQTLVTAGGNAWVSTASAGNSLPSVFEYVGGAWSSVGPTMGQSAIISLAAIGANDAWYALGSSFGKIGATQTEQGSSPALDTLTWIAGSSDSDIWTGGTTLSSGGANDGSLLHWNGSTVTRVTYKGASSPSAGSISTGFGFLGDKSGQLLARNGDDFTPITAASLAVPVVPEPYNTRGFGGTGPSDIYLAGSTSVQVGALAHFDGCSWSLLDPGVGSFGRLLGVWAMNDEVWVGGENNDGLTGFLLHKDASGWHKIAAPDNGIYATMWGSATDDVWFAGPTFMHWDGTSLTTTPPSAGLPPTPGLSSMSGSAKDDIWAVERGGDYASVFHYDGSSWSASSGLPNTGANVLFAVGRNDVWASGYEGLFHFDGNGWNIVVPGSNGAGTPVFSIWGSSTNDVWFGETQHWNGSTVETFGSQYDRQLGDSQALWGDGTRVWSAGELGIQVHVK